LTCVDACGPKFEDCPASTDLALFCYNPSAGETCCRDGNGSKYNSPSYSSFTMLIQLLEACQKDYYCTQDQRSSTWCCPDVRISWVWFLLPWTLADEQKGSKPWSMCIVFWICPSDDSYTYHSCPLTIELEPDLNNHIVYLFHDNNFLLGQWNSSTDQRELFWNNELHW
jgi:hypothetical protein